MPSTAFLDYSKKIVEDYLQNVIIVDDNVVYDDSAATAPRAGLTPPRVSMMKYKSPVAKIVSLTGDKDNADEAENDYDAHLLDAKKIVDSFAAKRIVCSVYPVKQEDRDNLKDTLVTLANSADILVLDWSLQKDYGEKALEVIEEIVKTSLVEPSQLRLLAIYSGERGIDEISKKIKKAIEKIAGSVDSMDDNFSLKVGSTKIVIYAKAGAEVNTEFEKRKVSYDLLPDVLTKEFAKMTSGLVPAVVLKALTQIRKNTPKILANFSSELDAPYLTHRALLPSPNDAEEHLTFFLGEEIKAIIEEVNAGGAADIKAIEKWLEEKEGNGETFSLERIQESPIPTSKDNILKLLDNGVDKVEWPWEGLNNKKKEKLAKRPHKYLKLTKMFNTDSENLDEKFSALTSLRTYYDRYIPNLTLGTIVKQVADGAYLVCLQPRCDSVRVVSSHNFLFLPLNKVKDDAQFDFVLAEDSKFYRMATIKKVSEIKLIMFKSGETDNGLVKAFNRDKDYFLKDVGEGEYKWLGELRFEQAQRLSNEFAATLSRVGLDESEWLRLWKTKG